MAKKKITGQDGKEYTVKEKKPFYKKIWFWVVVVILVIGGFSAAGGSDDEADSSDSTTKTEDKSSSSKKPASKITKSNFDKINVSESDGDSVDSVKKLFGKDPDDTSEDTIEDVKSEMYTWDNVDNGSLGSNIIVGFSNDHVISKNITGLKVNRGKDITKKDLNSIQNGTSKDDVKNKFGKPNGYDITNIAGQTDEMWEYTSGVKGGAGANFNITFTNDVVSGKSQSEME